MLGHDYEKELERIEKICREEGLEFQLSKVNFPVIATIKPNLEFRNQMVMDIGEHGRNTRNGEIKLIFADELTMQIIDDFTIEDSLLNRIKNATKKLHYIYLQMYFKEKTKLRGSTNV